MVALDECVDDVMRGYWRRLCALEHLSRHNFKWTTALEP